MDFNPVRLQAPCIMPKLISKLALATAALAIACVFAAPIVRAADEKADAAAKAEKKKKRDEETIKKYDKNGNGRLDPNEEAALKADQEKAKKK